MLEAKEEARSAEAFDAILAKLEIALSKADAADPTRNAVRFQGIVLDLFSHIEAARSLMMEVLRSENVNRTILQHVFGGDCVRISRARAVVESAAQMNLRGRHKMAADCLRACECVEQVLSDLGLGFSLRQAQIRERELLKQRRASRGTSKAPNSPGDSTRAARAQASEAEAVSPAERPQFVKVIEEPPHGLEDAHDQHPEEEPAALVQKEDPSVQVQQEEPPLVAQEEELPVVVQKEEPPAVVQEEEPPVVVQEEEPPAVVQEEEPPVVVQEEPPLVVQEPPRAVQEPTRFLSLEESPAVNQDKEQLVGEVDEMNSPVKAGWPQRPDEPDELLHSRASSGADRNLEPEAEPIDIGQADTASRPSKANAHPAPDLGDAEAVPAEQLPPYFYPHLQSLAGRVFLHYATGDCTAPGGATLSTTRFRCFLRDCSILSSSESAEALQRQPSNPNNLDRRPAPGLVVGSRPAAARRSSSVSSTTRSRKMSRQLSTGFARGFGNTAEVAAVENGKLPLDLCPSPVLTRAQADLLYIQVMKQQEVHMTQESFMRALAIVGQQCLAGMDPAEAPELHDSQASLLNWFCEWALVPLADALGISQHDVLCAAEILRDPAVSALLRSCQRGLDIVFARYAAASPAPREPYRKGFWTVQSMQRFAAESDLSAELSHQCLQGIFSGCVQYGLERRGVAGKMSSTCFRLALVVIAQRVHSAPGCTPLMRVAMFMLRLSICRGASDLGVAARAVLGKQNAKRF
ncbi:Uncharacterized protein SCF082_LOCUS38658 [Durusdinium trenchii]|uniref:Uncharacterized protein n=2 Tax=Durusdinium trenchii TaxID=1381693 RepID=A0ABP0Q2C7_9DINO